ncbi:hypothetical protein ACFL2Q_16030, partial [Thermodesulfobacteriota bacterium]
SYAACTVDLRGAPFELRPLPASPVAGIEIFSGADDPPRGWVSRDGANFPATLLMYHAKVTLPATLIWIMLPYDGRPHSGLKARRLDLEDGAVNVEIRLPHGVRDEVTMWPPDSESIQSASGSIHGKIVRPPIG